ncbi:MAG: hypothetical protein Q7S51_02355 [Gallionellaceae bacterium]|nr:hypothetical protein [Gallionellaceae bacterium]
MLILPLEPTDDRARPAFKDIASCTRWLGQFQLTNLQQAHGVLSQELDEFNRYPMQGLERWRTLELLRETVALIQADYAKKLLAKKLPLSAEEFLILAAILNLWQQMVTGYQRCLQGLLAGDKQLTQYGALLCQRCMVYSELQIAEQLRSGYEVNSRIWQQLHALYLFSEEQGFQHKPVSDELKGKDYAVTCHTIYIKILLTCYARPEELTRSQLQLLERWLIQWSAIITVESDYTLSQGDALPLALDMSGSQGLQALRQSNPSPASNMRYLPMLPLSKLLRVKTVLLQQGQSPQQLELGDAGSSADCIELLTRLHQNWCEESNDYAPGVSLPQAQLCAGVEEIYARIANKHFKPLSKNAGVDTAESKQIATFGRVLSEDKRHDLADSDLALETWILEQGSMFSARLMREGMAGMRLGANQIVAVRTENNPAFMLGTLSWVRVKQTGHLSVGVRYLPGMVQTIVINGTGINTGASNKSVAALLLPAVPTLKIPTSLVLPRGWFEPGRIIEMVRADHTKANVKLELSVDKGADYERVSYTLLT